MTRPAAPIPQLQDNRRMRAVTGTIIDQVSYLISISIQPVQSQPGSLKGPVPVRRKTVEAIRYE